MTSGPAAGEPGPGTEAPERATRERDGLGAILLVLALGLALRLIIAYQLPGSGFKVDLASFQSWAINLAEEGLYGFYSRPFFHDYTPGYLYVLWAVGEVGLALGRAGIEAVGPWTSIDLLKLPSILADLALGWLVWSMARELGAGRGHARLAAVLVVVNPVSWFDSVVWGQVDSFGTVFLLLGLRELWRDRPERAAILTVAAAIIKPQLGILVPLVAAVTIRRALRPAGGFGREAAPLPLRSDLAWERRARGPIRILTTGLAGLLTAIAISAPFGLSLPGLITQIFATAGGYPYLSVNAYNPWALLSLNGNGISQNALWVRDAPGLPGEAWYAFGPIPAVAVGALLLAAVFVVVTLRVAQRPDRRTMLVGLAILALAFFVVPTRVHERYLFPMVALGAILAVVSWRWRVAYLVASAAVFANMYVVLTSLYADNPGVRDWLQIAGAIRSSEGVTVVAISLLCVFLFALTELRGGALRRLAQEFRSRAGPAQAEGDDLAGISWAERLFVGQGRIGSEPASGSGAGAGSPAASNSTVVVPIPVTTSSPAPIVMSAGNETPPRPTGSAAAATLAPQPATWRERPTVIDAGYRGWLRSRLFERPIRPDRSRALHGERGGRLDRLDVWLILVLLASVLTIRVWRLAEPYQMHFDEVYHPRTATEFLQDWRYDISHDIYEWTHPHLAKYAMAGGLVLWGDDRVSTQGRLGVPVTAAAVEARWDESATAGSRAGDRVYVATGSAVRAYDLASRQLVATVDIPGASAVAVDAGRHRLLIGTQAGDLLALDTLTLDSLRRLGGGAAAGPVSVGADTIGHVDGAIRSLFAGSDGAAALAVLDDDRVATFNAENGELLAVVPVAGAGQMANAGSGDAIVARTSEITDRAAQAVLLAGLIGGTPSDIEDKLRSDAPVVFLGRAPTGDARNAFSAAVNEGRLPGVEIRLVRRLAVAGSAGVTFVDSASGSALSTLAVGGPAAGLALVTGVDTDRLYVAVDGSDGPVMVTVLTAGDSTRDGPVRDSQFKLPAKGGWVAYDAATQMVHVLGGAYRSEGRTVYVIEPHANAVYADAPLPFEPVALAMDANERYPSADRQQLLAFAADGAMGAVEVGKHAFAWRLPGVIAGAILAVLVYLLARLLFQRRSVAIVAGFLVLADGMLFAQSRIGMNDSYVGMFILAAYVLFAAIWTGTWRSWRAFWLAMPAIGLLLGLALAAKWVAAYSIGALGILILTRSALGRLVLIAGMIAATTFLGYMAITVPTGTEGGNYLFLALMIVLTGLAVVATVAHPIAWSWEEQRLVTWGPGAAGAAVALVALAAGLASTEVAIGPARFTPMEAGFSLILLSGLIHGLFLAAGRRGLGPMATAPRAGDPVELLEPPARAPAGWLRPGAFLGLPVAWMVACLVALPAGVYVTSYLPWAFIENHQLWPGWPAGHTGQTLVDLTEQMYRYHNTLTAAHAASSPWWTWPFDLKPVWFYQESFAGGTSASIYDAGNLVSWWLAVPALAFVAWQAFRRRSLALALIAIGFACQWIAWARIDRAAFQYHYYTSLPFVLLALAYLLAEVWHGASKRTWLLVRLAGATVVLGPIALWLLHRPLCALVRVDAVYPNSPSCPTLIPEFLLTGRALALAVVVGLGLLLLLRQLSALGSPAARAAVDEGSPDAGPDAGSGPGVRIAGIKRKAGWLRPMLPLVITAGVTAVLQLAVGRLVPDTPIVTLRNIPVEPIALVMLLPLLALATAVATARDARRFVVGCLLAVGGWFLVFYPNIAALPLPYATVNTYQGLLPTYVYTFQWPVSSVDRNVTGPGLLSAGPALLLVSLAVLAAVLAYSTYSWRVALAMRAARGGSPRLRVDPRAKTDR